MKTALYIATFFISVLLQANFLTSLPGIYASTPLHFGLGILMMHRAGFVYGFTWFAASAFLFALALPSSGINFAYLVVAVIGTLLMHRVFANRSYYALVGLGLSCFLMFYPINSFPSVSITEGLYGLGFTIASLSMGFFAARQFERITNNLFIIRGRT